MKFHLKDLCVISYTQIQTVFISLLIELDMIPNSISEDGEDWYLPPREPGYYWGSKITETWLKANNFTCIIRSHQMVMEVRCIVKWQTSQASSSLIPDDI